MYYILWIIVNNSVKYDTDMNNRETDGMNFK
jgi:hypothetical protein